MRLVKRVLTLSLVFCATLEMVAWIDSASHARAWDWHHIVADGPVRVTHGAQLNSGCGAIGLSIGVDRTAFPSEEQVRKSISRDPYFHEGHTFRQLRTSPASRVPLVADPRHSFLQRNGFYLATGGYNKTPFSGHALVVVLPYWILLAATVAVPFAMLLKSFRRRVRVRSGRCASCGYDVRASGARCPECGRGRDKTGAYA